MPSPPRKPKKAKSATVKSTPKFATVKGTAGSGFDFENNVATYFLVCMISSRPPFNPELGLLEKIEFQQEKAGWHLDDMILYLASANMNRRIAFSVKSNVQFGENTAPKEFVQLAWKQLLNPNQANFEEERDLLGLITSPLSNKLETDLEWLTRLATKQTPEILDNEIKAANKTRQKLCRSFECTENLTQNPRIGRLLRVLRFPRQYDFENVDSNRKREGIGYCRDFLVSESLEEAQNLWNAVFVIATEYRRDGGSLTGTQVFQRLYQFRFKGRPEHRRDWERLLEVSTHAIQRVGNTIGGIVKISRDNEIVKLDEVLHQKRRIAIIGDSGTGKSTLLRLWAEKELKLGNKIVWIEASNLENQSIIQFENSLRLETQLRELLAGITDKNATVVIDGLDRVYAPNVFDQFGTLFTMLQLQEKASCWRILIACQTPEWGRVFQELCRVNLLVFDIVKVSALTDLEMQSVVAQFPSILNLSLQPKLRNVFNNLQLLDRIAFRLNSSNINTNDLVSESKVIEWLWKEWFRNNATSSRFIKRMGELQADKLRSTSNEMDFEEVHLESLPSLIGKNICRTENGNIRFEHDLYGDWARQKILIDKRDGVFSYIDPRLSSPLWHRALKLYGQYLLENNTDETAWHEAIKEFSGSLLAQDLLLEAPIFASDSTNLLERIAPILFEDEGAFLKRLLTRFLHTGSTPNLNFVQQLVTKGIPEDIAEQLYRQPQLNSYILSWISVLGFLYQHRQIVTKIAPVQVANVVKIWLETVKIGDTLRREVSELGLILGKQAYETRKSYSSESRKNRPLMYEVALLAGDELPNETAEFALRLSERLEDEDPLPKKSVINSESDLPSKRKTVAPSYQISSFSKTKPMPWKNGPKRRIEETFQDVIFTKSAVIPLMRTRPKIAIEVMLANLINSPEDIVSRNDGVEDSFQVTDHRSFFPAFHTHGNFLKFLKINFEEGLELILCFIQFSVERWEERMIKRQLGILSHHASDKSEDSLAKDKISKLEYVPKFCIRFEDEERYLIGNGSVFGWYRGIEGRVPDAISSALMALEQILYEKLENTPDITKYLQPIVKKFENTAILGLLVNLARRHPLLLEGILNPLIHKLEVFNWDMKITIHEHSTHLMIGFIDKGEWFIKLAKDFHFMEHRKINLEQIVMNLIFSRQKIIETLNLVRGDWILLLEENKNSDLSPIYIKRMIIGLNPTQWEIIGQEGNGFRIKNQQLDNLQKENKNDPINHIFDQSTFLMQFSFKCHQILDSNIPEGEHTLEEFWKSIEKAVHLREDSTISWGINHPDDCILGGIAVLVRFHLDWLKQSEERMKLCLQYFKDLVLPLKKSEIASDINFGTDWDWLAFAGHIAPIFWAENVKDRILKECFLLILTRGHKKALYHLMDGCSRNRKALGSQFQSVKRFLIEFSALRKWNSVMSNFREMDDKYKELKSTFNVAWRNWFEVWFDGFIKGQSSILQIEWKSLTTNTIFLEFQQKLANHTWVKDQPIVDLTFIMATHEVFKSPLTKVTILEKQEWIFFCKQALIDILILAKPYKKYGDTESVDYPSEEARWILAFMAENMFICTPESASDLWKPIFSLPKSQFSTENHWIQCFLEFWHSYALSLESIPSCYIAVTREMFEYAVYEAKNGKTWAKYSEPWLELLCIGSYSVDNWLPQHKSIVNALQDIYLHTVPSLFWVKYFAKFLHKEASEGIRILGFQKIMEYISHNPSLFEDKSIQNSIISLLNFIWKHHETSIRKNQNQFDLFKSQLRVLVDQQHPSALTLQEKIAVS